jgi:hypothetical protein
MNTRAHLHHRKLKLSVGDIYLDSKKAKLEPSKGAHKSTISDPFISYKESCSPVSTQARSPSSAPTTSPLR